MLNSQSFHLPPEGVIVVTKILQQVKFFPIYLQTTVSQEPTFIPKIQIYFADFPYLHYSTQSEADNFGDLLRILVRLKL